MGSSEPRDASGGKAGGLVERTTISSSAERGAELAAISKTGEAAELSSDSSETVSSGQRVDVAQGGRNTRIDTEARGDHAGDKSESGEQIRIESNRKGRDAQGIGGDSVQTNGGGPSKRGGHERLSETEEGGSDERHVGTIGGVKAVMEDGISRGDSAGEIRAGSIRVAARQAGSN